MLSFQSGKMIYTPISKPIAKVANRVTFDQHVKSLQKHIEIGSKDTLALAAKEIHIFGSKSPISEAEIKSLISSRHEKRDSLAKEYLSRLNLLISG